MYKMLYTYKVTFYSHSKRGEMIFSDAQFPTKGLKKKKQKQKRVLPSQWKKQKSVMIKSTPESNLGKGGENAA